MWVALYGGLETINLTHVERLDYDPDDGTVNVYHADGRTVAYQAPGAVEPLLAAMRRLSPRRSSRSAPPPG